MTNSIHHPVSTIPSPGNRFTHRLKKNPGVLRLASHRKKRKTNKVPAPLSEWETTRVVLCSRFRGDETQVRALRLGDGLWLAFTSNSCHQDEQPQLLNGLFWIIPLLVFPLSSLWSLWQVAAFVVWVKVSFVQCFCNQEIVFLFFFYLFAAL